MPADSDQPGPGPRFAGAADAVRVAEAAMDFLNSCAARDLQGLACGETLLALGRHLVRSAAEDREGVLVPSPGAWDALRHAITRLAVDLVSGPSGVAAMLRRGLLDKPWNPPSLPLDIGYSHSIPGHIRRAVQLRDRTCAWPRCTRPAVHCDVHHLRHQADGGGTSVANCLLLCNFHHDVCVHRRGWRLILHPDGTTTARSPDGRRILHSHAPPTARAG